MAVLHGSWLLNDNDFFLWGETWRRLRPDTHPTSETTTIAAHPFALSPDELHQSLQQHQLHLAADCPPEEQLLQLPSFQDDSGQLRPLHSARPVPEASAVTL
ncbi:MAG: hypothetical protein R6U67_05060, partial [Sodalinema sp.]|uniref:hypothetical protein n=1 Tax=Sodalinema sp. TaxID=3080550 RepID=UPI00396F709A